MKSFSILFTESVKEVEDLNEQIQLLDEMPGANMDTRAVHKHLKKQGWSLTRSSGGHDVFTHPEAKHHIPVPRHRQLKAPLVKGILKQAQVNEESKGLWANIHAKRERIKNGSGERMRKPGSEGAPSEEDLKNSQVKEDIVQLDEVGDTKKGQKLLQMVNKRAVDRVTSKKADTNPVFAKKAQQTHLAANDRLKEDTLQEGRPSQRHPLEGHEYHKKTDAELEYIAKDAHKAAEAMKSHNTDAENKYRDQANDSATVRYFRKKNGMPNWYKKKYGHIKEDNVINTNTPNSVLNNPATQQATQTNVTKKKQVIDRYTTGKSSAVSGTTVVASPRESVEIQEGRMKSMADDDFHPTITKSAPPFDGPYKTKPKDVKDKSGAIHTPMSRARNLARQAARKNGGLKENNDNTLSSYDKDDTPAKQTLSKTAGMVKNLAKDAKAKAKTKTTNDKFQPEPELNSNIVR